MAANELNCYASQIGEGKFWDGGLRSNQPQAELFRHGALLQPAYVCGVHRTANPGALFRLPRQRL